MSRYIDADALKEKLQQHHDFFVKAWGGFKEMPIQDKARCDELSNSIAEIFNTPSIDIVRCKECKHCDKFPTWSACTYWSGDPYEQASVNPNDFCSYGEREGE